MRSSDASQSGLLKALANSLRPFNKVAHGLRITDRQLHRIADIRFKPEGIYCELDESESCGHIEFALTVPEIKEIIRNKRKKAGNSQTSKKCQKDTGSNFWLLIRLR